MFAFWQLRGAHLLAPALCLHAQVLGVTDGGLRAQLAVSVQQVNARMQVWYHQPCPLLPLYMYTPC